jgi:translation elongation factor EF-G
LEALEKGSLAGHPVNGVRYVLEDGAAHAVDSSELAFKIAGVASFREAYKNANPVILEPIMTVEITAPTEFQGDLTNSRRSHLDCPLMNFKSAGNVIGGVNQRRGTIIDTEVRDDEFTLIAEVSLNDMFGYSSALRGATQGKGEFSMEYKVRQGMLDKYLSLPFYRSINLYFHMSKKRCRKHTEKSSLKARNRRRVSFYRPDGFIYWKFTASYMRGLPKSIYVYHFPSVGLPLLSIDITA